jgi:hypothetical protein
VITKSTLKRRGISLISRRDSLRIKAREGTNADIEFDKY